MSGRYLLDTSILIALFADETLVKEKLAQASEVFIPSIAVGELYYWAWKSQRRQEHRTGGRTGGGERGFELQCRSGSMIRRGEECFAPQRAPDTRE